MIILYLHFETKLIIATLGALIFGLVLVVNKYTGGHGNKYVTKIESNKRAQLLIKIQWGLAIFSALMLPNNLLNRILFVANLYYKNELWIPVSMLIVLIFALICLGILFNFGITQLRLYKDKNKTT